MKRTPIIIPGQVYLNTNNEYAVVIKANRGDVRFRGRGFSGMNDSELFLERFAPVDPVDLLADEVIELTGYLDEPLALSIGWVEPDDEDGEDE